MGSARSCLSSLNGRGPVWSTTPAANRSPIDDRSQCMPRVGGARTGGRLDLDPDHAAVAELNGDVHFVSSVGVPDVKKPRRVGDHRADSSQLRDYERLEQAPDQVAVAHDCPQVNTKERPGKGRIDEMPLRQLGEAAQAIR
jgi:hypothetical protein